MSYCTFVSLELLVSDTPMSDGRPSSRDETRSASFIAAHQRASTPNHLDLPVHSIGTVL